MFYTACSCSFLVCTCTSVSASVTPAAKSSYRFHDKTQHCHCHRDTRCYNVLLKTEDVTYLRTVTLHVSVLIAMLWLRGLPAASCCPISLHPSLRTTHAHSWPHLEPPSCVQPAPAAGVNIDTLCVMFIHQEGCPTCSNICLKTWIVTFIFTNNCCYNQ